MSVPPDESKRTKQQTTKKIIMGTHISIFEAILISGATLFVYVFIKSLFNHFKSK